MRDFANVSEARHGRKVRQQHRIFTNLRAGKAIKKRLLRTIDQLPFQKLVSGNAADLQRDPKGLFLKGEVFRGARLKSAPGFSATP